MINIPISIFLLFIQIIIIYFLSRIVINKIFHFLIHIFRNNKLAYIFISILFFPGTALHELSHFFAATVLFLKVKELSVFPEKKNGSIKLGHVYYEKKDFIRAILVGISPFFAGLFFFWILSALSLFANNNLYIDVLIIYLIFSVSATMFSSKKDLQDMLYLIPIAVVIIGIIYIFDIKIVFLIQNKEIIDKIGEICSKINVYLFISIIINLVLILFFKIFKMVFRK